MRITIHRGTNEIGGSCVEVEYNGTRLLLDAGTPLDDSPAALPADIDAYAGVLISHSHQDHYGLVERLPEDVPLYMGKVAWQFAQSLRLFTKTGDLLTHNPIPLEAGKTFRVGDISVTPYLADHSSPDAFGFLLEAGGRVVYYTGDFRAHGRKSKTFDYLCSRLPRKMDAILLEGTMMDRGNSAFASEREVEEGMVEAIRAESGIVCLNCSAQNIDRMVSAFRAAKRSGRILVVDIYTAWILRLAQQLSANIPDINWDGMRVLSHNRPAAGYYRNVKEHAEFFGGFLQDLYNSGNELWVQNLVDSPSKYLIKLSDYWLADILDRLPGISSTIIYSQWAGYLEEGTPQYNAKAASLKGRENSTFRLIHTSGHAVREDLMRLVGSVEPQTVIPLHTEHKNAYAEYFPNVHVLDDGEVFEL
ncbi:metallo-beta-lactamase family protein [Pseudodesulfovibrio mercurii]|uniref:Metallo-beta-lactamase family protein n=1 Tax=Pseudodesulfovibrio mercurii TaxID=641491 RepID=F0JDX7_9BACT|nr:MBL fold metallo-hydrolase [Pseudodesulfovibrio mercurii]EGB13417.1 metallo-beta-lactamase family protein [Pseudodesulfovibrio mercurii]